MGARRHRAQHDTTGAGGRRWARRAAGGMAMVLVAGCVSGRGHDITVVMIPRTTTTTTTTTAPPTTSTTTIVVVPLTPPFVPAGCRLAAPEDIDVIQGSLVDGAARIGEAFVGASDGRSYIVANIYDGPGNQLSTADVWILERGQVFTLSGGAKRYTPDLPSAEHLANPPSAKDAVPLVLITACLVPSLRGG